MKKLFILLLLTAFFCTVKAQLPLVHGWKFKTGDSTAWATPGFDDKNWQPINIAYPWEQQGHDHYDGFGWYRLHVVIPSSLKSNAFIKDSVSCSMGYGDDGYAVYLNGHLVEKNYDTDIKTGLYGMLKFIMSTNNPAILWDKFSKRARRKEEEEDSPDARWYNVDTKNDSREARKETTKEKATNGI